MQAPARITSARSGCSPTIARRSSALRVPVELDLAVDLGPVEHRSLHDVGVVRLELVRDGCQVRDRAADADESVRPRPAVEPFELLRDRPPRLREHVLRDDAGETEPRGEAHSADVDAEALVDRPGRPNVNCELPPPVSKTTSEPSPRPSAEVAAR